MRAPIAGSPIMARSATGGHIPQGMGRGTAGPGLRHQRWVAVFWFGMPSMGHSSVPTVERVNASTMCNESTMDLRDYRIWAEPYYRTIGDENRLFEAAFADRMPMMLKGPTGCGKTRFVEFMAWRLGRPLVTVACHEDMTASDLVGRFLLDAQGTVWHDGPLTVAVRHGAICYLDEIVEARQDTTVLIHPLTDDRRIMPLEKKGELVHAHPDFQLVISYNPGYQSVLKDLKESTKQRFVPLTSVILPPRSRPKSSPTRPASTPAQRGPW